MAEELEDLDILHLFKSCQKVFLSSSAERTARNPSSFSYSRAIRLSDLLNTFFEIL